METITETPRLEILQGRQTTDDYPYGRLRCTRHMELEFKKGHGWRVAHTTVNPKTGRINAPKRSTYYAFAYLTKNPDTGYTEFNVMRLNSMEGIAKFIAFMREYGHEFVFTNEESQELWAMILSSIKISVAYTNMKAGYDKIADYMPATGVESMIKMYGRNAGIQEIVACGFDIARLTEIKAER